MPTLQEILRDPNYANANAATKQAIFERWAPQDDNYASANPATQAAIRQRFGIGGAAPQPAQATPVEPEADSGFFRQALDVPVGIAKGAVQGVRMVADAFGAGSSASNAIRGVEDYIGGLMSAQSKQDSQEISRIMQEAEDKGVGDQLKAALRAFMTAPVDLISQGLGTAAPVILAGLGSKVLGTGLAVSRGLTAAQAAQTAARAQTIAGATTGLTMGAGVTKGVIYDEVKQALKEADVPEEQAEARAQLAQSYGGENLDMILAGTALGGLGAVTGIEKPIATALARRIMGKAAATEAAEKVATEGAETAAKQSIARRYGTAMAAEGVPEFLQGSQEQLAANIALGREGFDVDPMRGVVGAGALEGLVGAGMGAGVQAVTGGERPVTPPPPADTTGTTTGTSGEIETPDTTETEETTTSLRDIFSPPAPLSPEEIKINTLRSEIADLDTKIAEMESRGASLNKGEKTALQNMRRQKKARDAKLAELLAAPPVVPPAPTDTPPAPPVIETSTPGESLGTTTTQAQQTETQGQTAPAAGTAAVVTDEDAQPDMIVPSDVSLDRPSDKEIDEEIKQKEAQVSELYNDEVEYAKLDDDGANLYDALQNKKLPDGMQLGSLRLQSVLDRNELTLPDLPDDFDTMSAQEQQQALEDARLDLLQQIEDKRAVLIPWEKLTVDQRQVYLDSIRDNTAEEHANARRALIDYRRRLREAQGKPKDLKASPEAGIYERNRATYKTRDRLEYPSWDDLNDEQRALYDATLRSRQPDPKKATAEDHDAAFKAVADKLVEEGYVPTPGMTYSDVRAAQLKQSEQQSKTRAQEEIKKEREQRKTEGPTAGSTGRIGGSFIPDAAARQVKEGKTENVLNYLRTQAKNKLHRAVAQVISNLGIKTKIKYVERLPQGRLAQYDPNSDTISVTAEGLKDTILLHEFVHAATVKVLDQYEKGNLKGLTEQQIEAAEMLEDLMARAKTSLGKEYPSAFKNLLEFVSYAMTDAGFQRDLEEVKLDITQGGKILSFPTILPETKSAWSEFMNAVLNLLGLSDKMFKGQETNYDARNALLEIFQAFESIAEVSEGRIERAPLPATQPKQADDLKKDLESVRKRNELPKVSTTSAIKRQWTGRKAYNYIRKKFQNSRDVIKRSENAAIRAGKVIFSGPKINAVYNSIILSSSRANDFYLGLVKRHEQSLRSAVGEYAKLMKMTPEEAARDLHIYAMAKHEGERRDVKYMLNVPLSTTPATITLPDGTTVNMAPSEFRIKVMQAIFSGKLKKADVEALRGSLDSVVQQYADPTGFSGIDAASSAGYTSVDRNAADYSVVGGYSPADMQGYVDALYTNQSDQIKAATDKAMSAMRGLQDATKKLDKESNYWSKPVQSVVDFYGWQNYIPLKGKQHLVGKNDDMLDFSGERLGGELQETQGAFEGRKTESDNSLIQSMVDATRAAMRAGRKDVTLAIKNAVTDKLLYGEVVEKGVPFADRQRVLYEKYRGPNFIYHYNADGTVDVILLSDKDQREAIKRTYEESQPLIDALNWTTSKMGQFHTRYNIAFAPMNFVRDGLTHAFMLGAEFGPVAAAQYIGAVSARVATGGLYKAGKVSKLYADGNIEAIKAMAKRDPYIAAMYEYLETGGKISYLQGISSKSQQIELQKDLSSSNASKALKAVNKVFDIYNDMFELSARTAAYEITKSQALAEGLTEDAARKKAAGYAKELANFETVGEWGKGAGAMFMFFRPAATGAVRAIDAIEPMFRSVENAVNELPQAIRDDPKALAEFKKNYKKQAASARAMTLGLMGMGAAMYMMAYMMADDDDYGRNKTATDDMNRWQRYARFYIPGTEEALKGNAIQIPWGFGLGAFASAGAQIAALGHSSNSVGDALTNVALVGMDSFLPLPVSKIDPFDKPAAWAMDSALPSIMRPFLEWTMNVDGLGREIYNNRSSRYGDAYTGGDNIPELYKSAARTLYDTTNGAVDWSPNTMYFFANSYVSGLARLAHGSMNIGMVSSAEKDFNPKTDTMLFDSFFGTPSNVDAREFAEAEQKILNIQKRLKTMEEFRPEQYAKYVEQNPMHPFIVESYNLKVNQTLRDLRKEANTYRRMPGLTPKERTDIVKNYVNMQNLIKRDILNTLEAYGLED
jgi:hypothetical protein